MASESSAVAAAAANAMASLLFDQHSCGQALLAGEYPKSTPWSTPLSTREYRRSAPWSTREYSRWYWTGARCAGVAEAIVAKLKSDDKVPPRRRRGRMGSPPLPHISAGTEWAHPPLPHISAGTEWAHPPLPHVGA